MSSNKFAFPGDDVLKRMKPNELDDLTTRALGISVNKGGENETPAGLDHAEILSHAEQIIIKSRIVLDNLDK